MPDWREADAYPDAEGITQRQWRWEFTRRRPDYRALWDLAEDDGQDGVRCAPDVDEFRLLFQMTLIRDPTGSVSDQDLIINSYPANGGFSATAFVDDYPNKKRQAELAKEKGLYFFRFDLSQPLGLQLERAERSLQSLQLSRYGKTATRRPRQANWRDFLRAIDARDAGASFAAIAAGLWPGQEKTPQSARDTYVAGCELRDNFPV